MLDDPDLYQGPPLSNSALLPSMIHPTLVEDPFCLMTLRYVIYAETPEHQRRGCIMDFLCSPPPHEPPLSYFVSSLLRFQAIAECGLDEGNGWTAIVDNFRVSFQRPST